MGEPDIHSADEDTHGHGLLKGAIISVFNLGHGMSAESITPPAGFSFQTASPATLAAYGVSPEPVSGEGRTLWQQMVSHMKAGPATQAIETGLGPSGAPCDPKVYVCNEGWAGYMNGYNEQTGALNPSGSYNSEEAYYYEPNTNYSTCATALPSGQEGAYYWVGLGGFNGPILAQNGTAQLYYGGRVTEPDYDWWEIVPEYGQRLLYPYITSPPGSEVVTSVQYEGVQTDPNTGQQAYAWVFAWYDYVTNQFKEMAGYDDAAYAQGAQYDNTAEFIAEVPGGQQTWGQYAQANFYDVGALSILANGLPEVAPQNAPFSYPADYNSGDGNFLAFPETTVTEVAYDNCF